MRVEARNTFGKPSLVIITETLADSRLIDEMLGNAVPFKIEGEVKLADGYGEHYIQIWNPEKHPPYNPEHHK
jgi:hypothetical protein